MKALLLIFSLLLVLLVAGLWVGSGGYPERWKTENRINAQQAENDERKKDINSIKADLEDVASGDGAIEERARSELGMTKENESFFEIILRPEKTQEPLNKDLINDRDLSGSTKSKVEKPSKPQTKQVDLTDTKRFKKSSEDVSAEGTSDGINEEENKKIDAEINNQKNSDKVKKGND